MSYYKNTYDLDPADFPNAEKLWSGTVSLPVYPGLSDIELEYICDSIEKVLKEKTLDKYLQLEKKNVI